jgi:hypothetical protein
VPRNLHVASLVGECNRVFLARDCSALVAKGFRIPGRQGRKPLRRFSRLTNAGATDAVEVLAGSCADRQLAAILQTAHQGAPVSAGRTAST